VQGLGYIEGRVEEGDAGEIVSEDACDPADDPLLGEVVRHWGLSTSWNSRSMPVGPLPRGSRFDGGKLRAWRKSLFSSSSLSTRSSKACKVC